MDFYSPLRYPGGKGKIANFIQKVFEDNNLLDGLYIEPYAGGASVALSLLMDEYASKIVINDIDKSIYSFWYSVVHDTENLCRLINDTNVSIANWRRQKRVQKNKDNVSTLDLGFSTFYLNRVNRSGIINAGVIGGIEQTGEWKMDARYNKLSLIDRIERIAEYADRIDIHNLDASVLLDNLETELTSNSLIYFDPPYYEKGKELYVNHYEHDDHEAIANRISDLDTPNWIVSYDSTPEIKSLYQGYNRLEYKLNYSAARASQGKEIMFFSDELEIPKVKNPAKM